MALPSDFNFGSWEGTPLTAADYSPQMLAEIERLNQLNTRKEYNETAQRWETVPDSSGESEANKYAQYIGGIVRRDRAMGYDIDASGLATTRPASKPNFMERYVRPATMAFGAGVAGMGIAGALGATAGAGTAPVAAGGAMDMAGSAGVGSALGGSATASLAELAAAGTIPVAAGGAMDMAGSAGVGEALGGAGTASAAELAAAGGAATAPIWGGDVPAGAGIGAGAGGVAANAAAGSALSRIIDGSASTADWVSVLGTAGATGLGMFSANQQANTLERLAAENRADRAPYLTASQGWLADPESYVAGPGQAAMKGTLAGLSAKYGNPIGSPTAMAISNEAALRDWRDAVTGFGNMGLSGADTRANLGMAGATADANKWTTLAGGVSDIINPRRSLADLLREYKTVFA